jgi:hypothetical protein
MRVTSYLFPDSLSIAILEIDNTIEIVLNNISYTSLKSILFYKNFYLLSLASLVYILSYSNEKLYIAAIEDNKLLDSL